jgi:hypothetical protein
MPKSKIASLLGGCGFRAAGKVSDQTFIPAAATHFIELSKLSINKYVLPMELCFLIPPELFSNTTNIHYEQKYGRRHQNRINRIERGSVLIIQPAAHISGDNHGDKRD